MRYTIEIKNEEVIKKLNSLNRKKGKYLEEIILRDIGNEQLERQVKEILNQLNRS